MMEINLLPWRPEKHAHDMRKARQFIVLCIVGALFLWMILHVFLTTKLQREQQDLAQFARNRQVINAPVMLADNISPNVVALLDTAAKSVVNGICLQRFMRNENGWELSGQALSAASMAASMQLFSRLRIREFKKDAAHFYFVITEHE